MHNYVPVLTSKSRPLTPCHPKRASSLVRAGKAQFKHRCGIRCIVLTKTNVPKVQQRSKLQLRIDPGARHTGIAITRDDPDGSRAVRLALVINHRGNRQRIMPDQNGTPKGAGYGNTAGYPSTSRKGHLRRLTKSAPSAF